MRTNLPLVDVNEMNNRYRLAWGCGVTGIDRDSDAERRRMHNNVDVCAVLEDAAKRSSNLVMSSTRRFLQLMLFSCVVSVHVAGGTGRDISKNGQTLIVRTRPLRCHECYMSIHGEACVELDTDITDVQYCRDDEPYCMVERFSMDGKLTLFSRACANNCTTECISAGHSYVERCSSCCQDNLCNTGSSRAPRGSRFQFALMPLVAVVSLLTNDAAV